MPGGIASARASRRVRRPEQARPTMAAAQCLASERVMSVSHRHSVGSVAAIVSPVRSWSRPS
jgi:hypothetical protein